jgi:hypothetical protein
MGRRPRHPNKHIEKAIQFAESLGWRVEISEGHAWGHLLCPLATRDGCMISVWSTPRNAEIHARQIRREIDRCPHGAEEAGHD